MTPHEFACFTVSEFLRQYDFPIKQTVRQEAAKRGMNAKDLTAALDDLRSELVARSEGRAPAPVEDGDHEQQ